MTEREVHELLGEHDGLAGIVADSNGDGVVTKEELGVTIVPLLFGVAVRAASYRPHLERALRADGLNVTLVGHSCRGSERDSWLREHGCGEGGGDGGFLGFYAWSAVHVLKGHPNQRQRGVLADWLRDDGRQEEMGVGGGRGGRVGVEFDVVLLHLGTNDLNARRTVQGVCARVLSLPPSLSPFFPVFLPTSLSLSFFPLSLSLSNTHARAHTRTHT